MHVRCLAICLLFCSFAPALKAQQGAGFDCAVKYCGQISSCAEAAYKLEVCGHTRRDGDGDGIPCEALCGQNLDRYREFVNATWPRGLAGAVNTLDASALRQSSGLGNNRPSPGQNSPGHQTADFACEGKRTCREMRSCDEARFYLTQCGVTSLDGDRDGVPCNRICRRSR